jgi:3D-(3,5/4)-trihydroxycyclohexane-1,2-dione acylhydrolase (decyclizing)
VTLAFCQDTQAEAFDWPDSFFQPRTWRVRRPPPDAGELADAVALLRHAKTPLIVAGGGVHYADAGEALAGFAERHNIPVAETQAGKGALRAAHPLNLGAIGVTGSAPANDAAAQADVILAVGTRLGDFTTGSWALFRHPARRLIGLNVQAFDAAKRFALPLVADAAVGLAALSAKLGAHRAASNAALGGMAAWRSAVAAATAPGNGLPTDAQVLGAVQRAMPDDTVLVGAAGGLPGEMHKLWQVKTPGTYHLEYGYSCMGYEIAGALGAKLAQPHREIVVLLGDGSWLMMHAELATSVAMGMKLIVVLLDNGGFGCIDRLQHGTGGRRFGTMLNHHEQLDFAAQAAGLGAIALSVDGIADLEAALAEARAASRSVVIVLRTDPAGSTQAGGHWWDVAVPEISSRTEVTAARAAYDIARQNQLLGE